MRLRIGCLLILAATTAARATEGESALSATGVFSSMTVNQKDGDVGGPGGGLMLDYQYGLSDSFWVRASLGGTAQSVDGVALVGLGSVGLTYAVDVFRYVPYVAIGAGGAVVGGGAVETAVKPYIELGVGLDVLESRSFSWGVDARFSSFASRIAYFTVGAKIAYRWGYF